MKNKARYRAALCFSLILFGCSTEDESQSSNLNSPKARAALSDVNNTNGESDALAHEGLGESYISGFTFDNKPVIYEKRNGLGFFEGDILLGDTATLEQWKSVHEHEVTDNSVAYGVAITGDRFRWRNNTVPYQFNGVGGNTVELVNDAIAHWEANTNINFVLRTPDNAAQFPEFVNITDDQEGCFSNIGRIARINQPQVLNIQRGLCTFGNTVHEFGHTLGLWHEQSREDRNNFVNILWDNIPDIRRPNFNQHINDGDDINEYDFGSIMHYGPRAFGRGRITIQPLVELPAGVVMGQRTALSAGDIAAINQLYPRRVPQAVLSHSSYSVQLDDNVFLDARNSFDPQGQPMTFDWNLGDGTVINSGEQTVNHTYEENGTYTVTLTVTDDEGNISTTTAMVTVYGIEILVPSINYILN